MEESLPEAAELQQWLDHAATEARLVVALAGSSQRMVQGMVLAAEAPLYGRAPVVLELDPIDPTQLHDAFGHLAPATGSRPTPAGAGRPRHWELAVGERGPLAARVERLVGAFILLGPLHREPDRILIGDPGARGAARAGSDRCQGAPGGGDRRTPRAARDLALAMLDRLIGMGLVRREVPFGESEMASCLQPLHDRRSAVPALVQGRRAPTVAELVLAAGSACFSQMWMVLVLTRKKRATCSAGQPTRWAN